MLLKVNARALDFEEFVNITLRLKTRREDLLDGVLDFIEEKGVSSSDLEDIYTYLRAQKAPKLKWLYSKLATDLSDVRHNKWKKDHVERLTRMLQRNIKRHDRVNISVGIIRNWPEYTDELLQVVREEKLSTSIAKDLLLAKLDNPPIAEELFNLLEKKDEKFDVKETLLLAGITALSKTSLFRKPVSWIRSIIRSL